MGCRVRGANVGCRVQIQDARIGCMEQIDPRGCKLRGAGQRCGRQLQMRMHRFGQVGMPEVVPLLFLGINLDFSC